MIILNTPNPSARFNPGPTPTPTPTDPPAPKETVLLVHGTFANQHHDGAPDWWRPGSAYCAELDARLQAAGSAARCWSHLARGAEPFAWSGANSEKDRIESGRALAEQIAALEADREIDRYHLVSHSHGGNVLLNALKGLQAVPAKLGGVVFMGTPYLVFRHRAAFDIRFVSMPLMVVLFGLSLWAATGPSDHFWVWAVISATLLASLLAEAFLSRRTRVHGSSRLYGSGTASAFVFKGDEAIAALRLAQEIADSPIRFVRQFASNDEPGPAAVRPTAAKPRGLFDRLTDSGIYVLIDVLQEWLGNDALLPPQRAGTPQGLKPSARLPGLSTLIATDPMDQWRSPIMALLAAIPAAKSYAHLVLVLLFVFVLAPRFLVAMAVYPLSLMGWVLSLAWRKVMTKIAEIAAARALPRLLYKGVFGADAGHFDRMKDLPPSLTRHESIDPGLQAELTALRARLVSQIGGSVVSVTDADDAFSIKTQVVQALTDVNLLHSHYYQSAHVIDATATMIAGAGTLS